MPYRNRGRSLRPINSVKHIVDVQGGLTGLTNTEIPLILGTDAPVLANVTEVETGARVNSIYLDVQAVGTAAGGILNQVYMYIFKNPGSNIATVPNGNAVGTSDAKQKVFHQEMRMVGSSDSDIPSQIFKGVIKIPKSFASMHHDDKVSIFLYGSTTSNYCIQCIYKEYR